MSCKFKIRVSTYIGLCAEAQHFYGKIEIPTSRNEGKGIFGLEIELDRIYKENYHGDEIEHTTIRFDNIDELIEAAKKWFLESPIVKPGDKLVIWKGYLRQQDLNYWTLQL